MPQVAASFTRLFDSAALRGLLCLSLAMAGSAQDKPSRGKTSKAERATENLVWPGPPLRPRIRWVALIQGAEDITGKRKLSFVERMSGKSPAREQLRLRKPYGVAVDQAGKIYVADPEQRGVLVFDRANKTASLRKGTAQFPLSLPICVAVHQDGRMFVSDSFAAQVVVFEPEGKPVAAFGKGTFKRPGGLAINTGRGWLYVVDVKRNEVLIFDLKTFRLLKSFGGPSKSGEFEPGTLSGPTNIALDAAGRVYVADTWNCRIQVFDPDGRFLRSFGTLGVRPGHFVRPKGVGIDSEGHVYVVDAGFSNFQVFTAEGKPLMFVGSAGDSPGQFLLPAGMAIDHQNRIYITEQRPEGGRLQIFEYLPDQPVSPSGGAMEARRFQ
ncbi:MAG: 6-bladed beta-propeller [Acidobacteriota bacterium]